MKVEPLVEMQDIRKNFGAVQALKGVDLILHRNEVLGLMGDNAAGKSTLMKVLSGANVADEGETFFEGEEVWEVLEKRHCSSLGKRSLLRRDPPN